MKSIINQFFFTHALCKFLHSFRNGKNMLQAPFIFSSFSHI